MYVLSSKAQHPFQASSQVQHRMFCRWVNSDELFCGLFRRVAVEIGQPSNRRLDVQLRVTLACRRQVPTPLSAAHFRKCHAMERIPWLQRGAVWVDVMAFDIADEADPALQRQKPLHVAAHDLSRKRPSVAFGDLSSRLQPRLRNLRQLGDQVDGNDQVGIRCEYW